MNLFRFVNELITNNETRYDNNNQRVNRLSGRRLKEKGKGVLRKGVLGARETPSRFSRAQNSLSLPFQTPATQASA